MGRLLHAVAQQQRQQQQREHQQNNVRCCHNSPDLCDCPSGPCGALSVFQGPSKGTVQDVMSGRHSIACVSHGLPSVAFRPSDYCLSEPHGDGEPESPRTGSTRGTRSTAPQWLACGPDCLHCEAPLLSSLRTLSDVISGSPAELSAENCWGGGQGRRGTKAGGSIGIGRKTVPSTAAVGDVSSAVLLCQEALKHLGAGTENTEQVAPGAHFVSPKESLSSRSRAGGMQYQKPRLSLPASWLSVGEGNAEWQRVVTVEWKGEWVNVTDRSGETIDEEEGEEVESSLTHNT